MLILEKKRKKEKERKEDQTMESSEQMYSYVMRNFIERQTK